MKTLLLALLIASSSSALFAESAKIGNSLYLKPAFAPLMVAAAEVGSSADPSGTFAQGYADGKMAAQNRSYTGVMGGGFIYGVFTGVIGTGIIFGLTKGDAPPGELVSGTGNGSDYRAGFTAGYKEASKKKKRMARLGGGLMGTAAFVIGYLSATS